MAEPVLAPSANATSDTPSQTNELDEALHALSARAEEFARLPVVTKAALLRECIPLVQEVAPDWVARGARAKGLAPLQVGEEWLAGPMPTVRNLRLLAESLDAIVADGKPPLGRKAKLRGDGRLQVDCFPTSRIEEVLFAGISGYVVLDEGVDRSEARRRQASFYDQKDPKGGISVILGAGNVSSIPPMDALTKMFVEGYVCIIKMNPVNEWVGPCLEKCLAPLIQRDYLRVVYGGGDVGKYLVEHDAVADVHITGSDKTHDLIVWGPPGPDREARVAENRPLLEKPISSELGNISPVAIVPYTYTEDELWFQARNVATMVGNNGSFNCNAAKLLVTSKEWAQRDSFLAMVEKALSALPTRKAYYPGAFDRHARLVEGRDNLATFGSTTETNLAWTFIRDVDSEDENDPVFSLEPFCGVISETTIGSADPVEFLNTLVPFLNDRVWGTLNAMLIVHPKLESDPTVARALDRAIIDLRYGTVAINVWPAVCYGSTSLPWGGHQDVSLDDIQSGLGWVHNTYMLEGIDKSVVRGPLKLWPDPVWYVDNHRSAKVGPRLVDMEAAPSWLKVPGLAIRTII